MKLTQPQLAARFNRAMQARSVYENEWEDAYRFAFPGRESWYHQAPGQNRSRLIFDETAVEATQEFASSMAFGLTPSFAEWFRLEPGALANTGLNTSQRSTLQGALDEVTAFCYNAIDASDFQPANHEMFLDLALGWGTMWVDQSTDPNRLLDFRTLPQNQVYVDLGPGYRPDGRFRKFRASPADLREIYGNLLRLPMQPDAGPDKDGQLTVVDGIYRDWSAEEEKWCRAVWHHECVNDGFMWEREYNGFGSCPAITPRWSTTSFEPYGRGPLYNVLPAIRTANLVTQLTLENAEMAIVGMWQGDDDGIVNFDSIDLIPGTVIPRDPESRGLEALTSPARFDVSNLIIQNMQTSIRRALFNVDLGPMDKTPMSATEAAERQSQLARRIGAPFARLLAEYLSPFIRRVVHVLEQQGKIELPMVDGRVIQVVSRSPLARAQRQESVAQFVQYDQIIKQTFGDLAVASHKKQEVLDYLADKMEVPKVLRADEDERATNEQAIMEAMQPQQPPPGPPQ